MQSKTLWLRIATTNLKNTDISEIKFFLAYVTMLRVTYNNNLFTLRSCPIDHNAGYFLNIMNHNVFVDGVALPVTPNLDFRQGKAELKAQSRLPPLRKLWPL